MNDERGARSKKCTNDDSCAFKRTIRNNPTLEHWRIRNSSIQMNTILHPDDDLEKAKSECSCGLECDCAAEVTKTAGRIKWKADKNTQSTKSKYHTKCCIKKPESPRFEKPNNIKRNQVLSSRQCEKCTEKCRRRKFKNECYCSSKPDKPLIPIKPAVTQPNIKRTIKSGSGITESDPEPNHNLETLKIAKNLLGDYAPESNFLRKLQKEARQVFDCQCSACKVKEKCTNLQYTKRRQMLENAYDDVEKSTQSLDNIGRNLHKCRECKKQTVENSPKNLSPRNLSPTDVSCTAQYSPRTSLHFVPQKWPVKTRDDYNSDLSLPSSPKIDTATDLPSCNQCTNIRAVKKIRDENYFDTHSTSFNLASSCGPNQQCVHRFTLDKRLLPTPLNADAFGVSRCINCNKPMQSMSDNYKTKSNNKHSKIKKMGQSKYNPRKINIADKNEIIELKVPSILISNQKDLKLKYPLPHNTLALRHQRRIS